jgi:hypothetical protein
MDGQHNRKVILAASGVSLVAVVVTLPIVRLVVPRDVAHAAGIVTIAALCLVLDAKFARLDLRAARRHDDTRKIFLIRTVQFYFAGLAVDQILGILWISGAFDSVRASKFIVVSGLIFFAFLLLAVQLARERTTH